MNRHRRALTYHNTPKSTISSAETTNIYHSGGFANSGNLKLHFDDKWKSSMSESRNWVEKTTEAKFKSKKNFGTTNFSKKCFRKRKAMYEPQKEGT